MRLVTKFLIMLLLACFVTSNANRGWSWVCVNQEGVHFFAETCGSQTCHELVLQGTSARPAPGKQITYPDSSEKDCVDLPLAAEFHSGSSSQAAYPASHLPLLYDAFQNRYALTRKIAPLHAGNRYVVDMTLRMQRAVVLLI